MDTKDIASGLPEIIKEARALGPVEFHTVSRHLVASVPEGRDLVSLKPWLDEFQPTPDRRRGTQTLVDLPSFCDWVNRNKVESSVLFCDPARNAPVITAVIDYHLETNEAAGYVASDGRDGVAQWLEFSGRYPLVLSPKWKVWAEVEKKGLSVVEFAAFLEEHALDLHAPETVTELSTGQTVSDGLPDDVRDFLRLTGGRFGTPREIMNLARGIDVNVGAKVQERFRTASGERALRFEEAHETKQGDNVVVVPDVFLIAIPVFDLSSAVYRLPVRLTYRIHQGQVVWGLTCWRAEETFDAAVRDMATKAHEATELQLFFGPAPKGRNGSGQS